MAINRSPYDDEIDFIEIIQTLWNGKWIILATTLISLLGIFSYFSFQKTIFNATTEIKPINSVNFSVYQFSNNLDFFKVTQDTLLSNYIEQLEIRNIFEEATVKYELLDREKFEDEQTFNEAVEKFAYSIKILPPGNVDGKTNGARRINWVIETEHYNKNKLKQFLSYVDSMANQNVRNNLQKSFKNSLVASKQKREFAIEDNITNIENAISDYDRMTSNKLFFLREQAAIARTLGVAKNTIEAQSFGTQNGIIASLETKTPYYLRGYEAIEKEIELIESRPNKLAFVDNLLKLEQAQRKLIQDGILLERAENLFKQTPIIKGDDFFAASMKSGSTKFSKKNRGKMIVVVTILGAIIAAFYVLVSNAMHRRKDNSVKV